MRRLAASDLLPDRAGQAVKAWVHISLADLMVLDGSSALQEEWTARVRARWAAHRAAGSQGGGDGGAWLDGDAARAIACDAAIAPVVTGDVNVDALEDLIRLCVQLDKLRHGADAGSDAGFRGGTVRDRGITRNSKSARPGLPGPAGRSQLGEAAVRRLLAGAPRRSHQRRPGRSPHHHHQGSFRPSRALPLRLRESLTGCSSAPC